MPMRTGTATAAFYRAGLNLINTTNSSLQFYSFTQSPAKSPGHDGQGHMTKEPLAVLEIRTRATQIFTSVALDQKAHLFSAIRRSVAVGQPALHILHRLARIEPLDFKSRGGEQSHHLGRCKRARMGTITQMFESVLIISACAMFTAHQIFNGYPS